jgi:predicted PurR-regulated permease PerM
MADEDVSEATAEDKETIAQFITRIERRTQRIFISALVSVSIIALCTTAALVWVGFVVRSNQNLANKTNEQTQQLKFTQDLAREKVCAENENQIENCQALFSRLTRALSLQQRVVLSCAVIRHLHGDVIDTIFKQNPQCPRQGP